MFWTQRASVNFAGLGLLLGGVLLVAAPGAAGVLDASWTAPTTNTDGSPLADLASYRVYYATSNPPCPGATFFQVASVTPSPAPNQTESFKLAGLSTGTSYNVSVTAVDASGNESDCSTPASAVAQREFSVSPTGTVNFGTVNVGSVANQALTVQNTRGGTVSGSVSTSAPFSIVSGSPFTLVGAGTTQAVTVRFSPTVGATASVNVTFSTGGDTISRLATGTGNAPDTTPPTVTITTPTADPNYTVSSSPLTLAGTAADTVGVTQVSWTNTNVGSSGTATGTTSWTASGIALQPGTNELRVTARDGAGNTATDIVTVTLSLAFTFTDDPLMAQSTPDKATHIMELRAAIDSIRVARGLATFAWTDPTLTPGSTPIRMAHLTQLRTALDQAYQAAGRTLPAYTDPTIVVGLTVIRAAHLNELRATVRALQ
jgi:fibronectin type III domain protein